MTEPLSAETWPPPLSLEAWAEVYAPMTAEQWQDLRAEHRPGDDAWCRDCSAGGSQCVAMLLAEFDRLKAELDRGEANPPRWQGRDHHSPAPHLKTLVDVRERITGLREHDGVSCCEWATDGPCPWSSQGVQGALFGPSDSTDFTPREA